MTIQFKEASIPDLAGYLSQMLHNYAYEPGMVYALLVLMMLLSAFGLPIPEEVTLLSVGFIAYMGAHPDLYPPPFPGAPVVNKYEAAAFAFLAVFVSDFLIYGIGRKWGRKVLYSQRFSRIFKPSMMEKVEAWTHKYGAYACGIFRFTPGVRFPGHLACGMLKFPVWKFALIDGLAALISVPTQILLLAHYGDDIIRNIKQFKMWVFGIGFVLLIAFIAYKLKQKWRNDKAQPSAG